jgi:hypothetical protein
MGSVDPAEHQLLRSSLWQALEYLDGQSALQLRGRQPGAFQFALIVLTPVAALVGMHEADYRW